MANLLINLIKSIYWKPLKMIWIIKLLVTTVLISKGYSTQDYERTIIDCCKLGQDFADRWPSIGCSTSNPTLLSSLNVTNGYFTDCEITFSLCCSARHQSVNCDHGKSLAQSSTEKCTPSINLPRYTEHSSAVYECCQACKLGSIAREEGRSCLLTASLNFTKNWIKSFTECCQAESKSPRDDSRERETDTSETKSVCENGYLDSNERCKCNQGYKLNPSGSSCVDINECVELDRACAPWQSCNNQLGSYNCTNKPIHQLSRFNQYLSSQAPCPPGLTRSSSGCIDMDECELEPPVCHSTLETCVNILGSYRCERQSPKVDPSQCPAGYRSINSQCIDIDECLIGMHRCKPSVEDCINIPGSYECRPRIDRLQSGNCDRGYNRNIDTGLCEDIDECVDFTLCPDTHRCFNVQGSYLCIRKNECGTGYAYNLTSDNCDDIDECELTPTICGSSVMFKCINTPGTYRCTRIACPPGQNLQPDGTCQSIQCPNGFERNSLGTCEDIDECLIPERCPPGHTCVNLVGTYQCRSVCESGLRYDANSNTCRDIDECSEGRHNCLSGQTCINKYRSFSCLCPMGQQLDEYQRCVDIDECSKYGSEVCPVNSICVNKQDSFDCICQKGYRKPSYSIFGCVDIDECEETPWVCPHKCINTQGSYICSCSPGYRLADDEKTCIDIDECAENIAKMAFFCEGRCNNTEGSYVCSCPEGFQARDNRFCDDINECERNKPCGESICLNTIGGYKCFNQDCPEGYIRDVAHTHRCKKPRKAVQCVGDQCYEIYKKPLSYSYSYISLPSDVLIPSSGKLALFTARGPLIPGSEVLFKLNVTSIEADNSTEPAVRDDFHLASAYNEAIISLIKPLKGEQLAKLELDLELYQGDLPSGTTKIILMLHISKHPFQKSRRMKLQSNDIRK
ncbi:fibulin-1-like [Tetranychus urticae]|uniref:EGF-like domain-containing protein n=1 Tax=Tetranychus urticae TaxID=32264 RepID=T1K0I3_TETUR|nr:fibulin-1-like [Tetranychus urticae]